MAHENDAGERSAAVWRGSYDLRRSRQPCSPSNANPASASHGSITSPAVSLFSRSLQPQQAVRGAALSWPPPSRPSRSAKRAPPLLSRALNHQAGSAC